MHPDRNAEFAHFVPERQIFGAIERLAGDVGVDLHAERAEFFDRALRLGDAGIRRGERNLRHPAGKVILFLGDEFGEAVVDDAAKLVDLRRRLGDQLDRRLRVRRIC